VSASPVGHFLVAGRFMRALYGVVKAVAFGWILLIQPWPALLPEFWVRWGGVLHGVSMVLVLLAVAMCLLRGVPVILAVLPRPAPKAVPKGVPVAGDPRVI
jgi:CDP-diacylglycerol--glycerol-3-phosphate 3-phosphatidyltransferase